MHILFSDIFIQVSCFHLACLYLLLFCHQVILATGVR